MLWQQLPIVFTLALAFAPGEDVTPSIDWQLGSIINAQGKARHEERELCVYFWATGSEHCKTLFQGTLSRPEVAQALSGYVCFSADVSKSGGRQLLDRYRVSVLPTVLFTDADGKPTDAIVGAQLPSEFLSQLTRIQSGKDTIPVLRAAVAAAPGDFDARLQLALKLDYVGLVDESREMIAAIRKEDPEGKTLVGARLAFIEVRDSLQQELTQAADPTEVDLAPMVAHAAKTLHQIVKFEAWQWITVTETQRGAQEAARHAFAEAWKIVPDQGRFDIGYRLVLAFFDQREKLDRRERKLTLEVAKELERLNAEFAAAQEGAAPGDSGDPGEEGDPEGEGEEEAAGRAVMARSSIACALFVNGKRGDARREAKAALELEPENGELQRLLDPILKR